MMQKKKPTQKKSDKREAPPDHQDSTNKLSTQPLSEKILPSPSKLTPISQEVNENDTNQKSEFYKKMVSLDLSRETEKTNISRTSDGKEIDLDQKGKLDENQNLNLEKTHSVQKKKNVLTIKSSFPHELPQESESEEEENPLFRISEPMERDSQEDRLINANSKKTSEGTSSKYILKSLVESIESGENSSDEERISPILKKRKRSVKEYNPAIQQIVELVENEGKIARSGDSIQNSPPKIIIDQISSKTTPLFPQTTLSPWVYINLQLKDYEKTLVFYKNLLGFHLISYKSPSELVFKCNDTILHFSTPNTENSASANSYLTQLRFHNFISQDLLEKGLKIRNIEYSKQIIKGDQKNLINQAIEIIDPNGISLVFNDYSGILKRKR